MRRGAEAGTSRPWRRTSRLEERAESARWEGRRAGLITENLQGWAPLFGFHL